MKPARIAWWIFALLVALFIVAPLVGCATERYLTVEQDDKLRAFCERQGCQVVPTPIWRQVEQLLKTLGLMTDA